jgi:hypothetical protein
MDRSTVFALVPEDDLTRNKVVDKILLVNSFTVSNVVRVDKVVCAHPNEVFRVVSKDVIDSWGDPKIVGVWSEIMKGDEAVCLKHRVTIVDCDADDRDGRRGMSRKGDDNEEGDDKVQSEGSSVVQDPVESGERKSQAGP